ncbi:MAG: alpha/beta fold hydrolase [Planctomycetota bacterium]
MPPFRPSLWLPGGHLQTVGAVRHHSRPRLNSRLLLHELPDGDSIGLHDEFPSGWQPGDRSFVLFHGLCGCHGSSYMIRLAERFASQGARVFRVDMRGCGSVHARCAQLTHAGRSDDVLEAMGRVALETGEGPILAVGVSLGGNQLLRALGRVAAGLDMRPEWFDRLEKAVAIAPPIDLFRCSNNMQRITLRPYNWYFIRLLLRRIPPQVENRKEFRDALKQGRPATLLELDDRFTAPLSGFRGAHHYYGESSARQWMDRIDVPVRVLVAQDDPIVPVGCYLDDRQRFSDAVELMVARRGGHVGYLDRRGEYWMDEVIDDWCR